MMTIEFRVEFTGSLGKPGGRLTDDGNGRTAGHEFVRVQAVNINSGLVKAVKAATIPLGNGFVREVGKIEFWQVCS